MKTRLEYGAHEASGLEASKWTSEEVGEEVADEEVAYGGCFVRG